LKTKLQVRVLKRPKKSYSKRAFGIKFASNGENTSGKLGGPKRAGFEEVLQGKGKRSGGRRTRQKVRELPITRYRPRQKGLSLKEEMNLHQPRPPTRRSEKDPISCMWESPTGRPPDPTKRKKTASHYTSRRHGVLNMNRVKRPKGTKMVCSQGKSGEHGNPAVLT